MIPATVESHLRLPSASASGETARRAGDRLVAIEIGGTKLQIVTADAATPVTVASRWRGTVDRAAGGEGIQRQIRAGLAELLDRTRPLAVAVGFGGPVDRENGRVCRSHQIAGWENFALGDWLAKVAGGVRVVVENDANAAALGEAIHGAGAGLDPVFYVTLGSGVGGGLVAGGAIYHGASPGEAEFGHLRLGRDGATVESRCSGWSVDRRLRQIASASPDGALARLLGDLSGGEAKQWAAALARQDADARQLLEDVAGDLAFALSHVVHLMHPRVIVLGGGLSLVGEPLRAAVADALPDLVMDALRPGPAVRLAALGEGAVPIGALELAARAAVGC